MVKQSSSDRKHPYLVLRDSSNYVTAPSLPSHLHAASQRETNQTVIYKFLIVYTELRVCLIKKKQWLDPGSSGFGENYSSILMKSFSISLFILHLWGLVTYFSGMLREAWTAVLTLHQSAACNMVEIGCILSKDYNLSSAVCACNSCHILWGPGVKQAWTRLQ